jgi:hypothetical protein
MNPSAELLSGIEQASPTTAGPVTLSMILSQPKYHVARESWFDLLQDDGVEMGDEEKKKYGTPTKGKRNNKHYNVAFGGRFYPKIYQLAAAVVGKIKEFPEAYPRFNHTTSFSTTEFCRHPCSIFLQHFCPSFVFCWNSAGI